MDHDTIVGHVERYGQTLYRTARSLLASEEDCMDALQEAVTKAWASRSRLREERYFRSWLTRIVINECRNIQRRQARVVPTEAMEAAGRKGADAGPVAQPGDQARAIMALVDALPEKQRLVIALHCVEGLPVAEVARILRVPHSTVRGRLYEARKALKLEWDEEVWGL